MYQVCSSGAPRVAKREALLLFASATQPAPPWPAGCCAQLLFGQARLLGDYLNDDSPKQARAPDHTKPKLLTTGSGCKSTRKRRFPTEGGPGWPGLVTAACWFCHYSQAAPGMGLLLSTAGRDVYL